jgi:hypothetical protein
MILSRKVNAPLAKYSPKNLNARVRDSSDIVLSYGFMVMSATHNHKPITLTTTIEAGKQISLFCV